MSSQDARNLQPWGRKSGQMETVQEQLFGNLEQLHEMTMFITEAGPSIWF
jgi:hypothetical protein